ncbi:MAG: hypothetical protein KKB24_04425 [Candidatus Altiarchaeota archaeon]|nr:hypothetical protein [Candidatus Altiarchaeota archaeon]
MKRLVIFLVILSFCFMAAADSSRGKCRTHELPSIPAEAAKAYDAARAYDSGIKSAAIKPQTVSLGDTTAFWIQNFDTQTWFQIDAVLRNVTSVAYVYVQTKDTDGNAIWVDTTLDPGKLAGYITQADVDQIAAEFDSIYANDRLYFGEEEPEGVDGDSRITILLTDIDESYVNGYAGEGYTAGYFWSVNEFSESYVSPPYHSNERKMFYIDTFPLIEKGSYDGVVDYTPTTNHEDYYIAEGSNNSYPTIAHEFQHMIHWYHDSDEETWVDEGCAVYAEYINGYGHPTSDIEEFCLNYGKSLTEWTQELYDYGKSYLFMLYLSDHYGGNLTIKEVVSETDIGITGINQALSTRGYTETFTKIFNDWTIANVLDDTTIGDGLYGYLDLDFIVPVTNILFSYPTGGLGTVNYWAAEYIGFTSGNGSTLNISFNGGNSENFNASVAKIAASSNELEFIPLDSVQDGELLVSGFGSTYNSAILIISNDENSTTAAYAITVAQLASTTTTTTTSTTSTTSTTTSTSTTISGGLEATSTEASMGETITINVTVSNAPNDVESLGFDLTYDGNALQYNSYVNGSLVEGFDFFGVNNISSEAVRVGAFTTQNTIQAGESGSIVEFTFTVIGCYNSQLVLENLADNVSSWAVSPGESTCPGATTTTTTTTTSTSTIMDCLKGDSDCNGTVSDFELLNYIDLWVNGQVGDFDVLEAIDNWTSG